MNRDAGLRQPPGTQAYEDRPKQPNNDTMAHLAVAPLYKVEE
jgi:hypothetical protein